MKLSGYNINQQKKNNINNIDSRESSRGNSLKDGQTYSGRITSIDGNELKVNIKGREYTATLNKGSLSGKQVGDEINFELLIKDSKLLLNLKDTRLEVNIKNLDSIIMNLSIAKTDENLGILEMLKAFKIPLTRENFEELKSLVTSKDLMLSTLNKELEANNINLGKLIDKELSLKDNLIRIFNQEASDNLSNAKSLDSDINTPIGKQRVWDGQNTNEQAIKSIGSQSRDILGETLAHKEIQNYPLEIKDNTKGESNNGISFSEKLGNTTVTNEDISNIKNELIKDAVLVSNIDNKLENEALKDIEYTNLDRENVKGEELTSLLKVIDSLKNIDESTFLFNKEMQIPNIIKNLIGFDNLINMKDSIVSQLQKLLEGMDQLRDKGLDLSEIINKLDDLKLDEFDEIKDQLLKIERLIEKSTGEISDKLKKDLILLKDSIEYIKDVNNQVVYIQSPINFNGQIKEFEMGVRKSTGPNEDSFKIFISLNTINLGLVQSLININKENIEIGFKVDEEYDKYFKESHDVIKSLLNGLGYKNVLVKNIIREGKLNLTDLVKADFIMDNNFDYLV